MANEDEVTPAETSAAVWPDGVDSSRAVGLILASLGESRRPLPGPASEIPASERPENPSWQEAETLLKDAELVVKATGPATAHLLREIYVRDWLREQ